MAFLRFNNVRSAVDMGDSGLVSLKDTDFVSPTAWSWLTADGHDVEVRGAGMSFDSQGRLTGGRATEVGIDLDNNSVTPNVQISGFNVEATLLDDSPRSFWNAVLGGNDVINVQGLDAVATGSSVIFGDDLAARTGTSASVASDAGANDVFIAGGGAYTLIGDVHSVSGFAFVEIPSVGIPGEDNSSRLIREFAVYDAGDDTMTGTSTGSRQTMIGDALRVEEFGILAGGHDRLSIASTDTRSLVVGDAVSAEGTDDSRMAQVLGGDDTITGLEPAAATGSRAMLVGDVDRVLNFAEVNGGADTLTGSDEAEQIAGDVRSDESGLGSRILGGADTVDGRGGNDMIAGDVLGTTGGAVVKGGADTLRGGAGDDFLFGEVGIAITADSDDGLADLRRVSGGNDVLFGDAGNDTLFGQTGDDRLDGGEGTDSLDGGAGRDTMAGGAGNDTYVVDQAADVVAEAADQGFDSVRSTVNMTLATNVEALVLLGGGNLNGNGNAGRNSLTGNGGGNRLDGKGDADAMAGRGGNDVYVVDHAGDRVTERADEGTDAVLAGVDFVLGANVERLQLTGNGNIAGQGNGLDNVLTGNAGSNVLTGGAGADSFQFINALGAGNVDRITDFSAADDTVRLSGKVFDAIAAGRLADAAFHKGEAAADANDRILYDPLTGALRYDADGTGATAAVQFATLGTGLAVAAADFIIF